MWAVVSVVLEERWRHYRVLYSSAQDVICLRGVYSEQWCKVEDGQYRVAVISGYKVQLV